MSNQQWFKKQPDAFYLAIQDIFTAFGPPYGAADNKIVPNGFFGLHKEEEITRYSYLHTESIMLMFGLMVLSWLKLDLKKKTENGHCHNRVHKAKDTNKPASCPVGSNFHRDLYSDYISILEDYLNNIRNSTPTPISSSN